MKDLFYYLLLNFGFINIIMSFFLSYSPENMSGGFERIICGILLSGIITAIIWNTAMIVKCVLHETDK